MGLTPKDSAVYAIRCNGNGKMYIGATKNLNLRIQQHIAALRSQRHPVRQMQLDFNEYDCDFSVCVLAEFHTYAMATEINRIEHLYMTIFDTRNPAHGYNYADVSNNDTLDRVKFYPLIPTGNEKNYDPRKRKRTRK